MRHERVSANLWIDKIRLYASAMTKNLYNLRLLGDGKLRNSKFGAFLDSYSTSLDVYPVCNPMSARKAPDRLWSDFVKVSQDANRAVSLRLGEKKPQQSDEYQDLKASHVRIIARSKFGE